MNNAKVLSRLWDSHLQKSSQIRGEISSNIRTGDSHKNQGASGMPTEIGRGASGMPAEIGRGASGMPIGVYSKTQLTEQQLEVVLETIEEIEKEYQKILNVVQHNSSSVSSPLSSH